MEIKSGFNIFISFLHTKARTILTTLATILSCTFALVPTMWSRSQMRYVHESDHEIFLNVRFIWCCVKLFLSKLTMHSMVEGILVFEVLSLAFYLNVINICHVHWKGKFTLAANFCWTIVLTTWPLALFFYCLWVALHSLYFSTLPSVRDFIELDNYWAQSCTRCPSDTLKNW